MVLLCFRLEERAACNRWKLFKCKPHFTAASLFKHQSDYIFLVLFKVLWHSNFHWQYLKLFSPLFNKPWCVLLWLWAQSQEWSYTVWLKHLRNNVRKQCPPQPTQYLQTLKLKFCLGSLSCWVSLLWFFTPCHDLTGQSCSLHLFFLFSITNSRASWKHPIPESLKYSI